MDHARCMLPLFHMQWLVKAGITARVSFVYELEPRASGKICSSNYQTCVGLYDSWPGNTLNIYAWYQLRDSLQWCGGWVS